MKGWAKKTIGELCDAGGGEVKTGPFGAQLHQSDYQVEGTPVVMPTDIIGGKIDVSRVARVSDAHVDRLHKHKLYKGDIVYGRRGDIGRQALVREENVGWLCGTGCLRVSPGNTEVVPEFLHLYLSLPEIAEWVENQAVGATMPNLNTGILRRVPVWFPTNLNIQRKIASIVFAYDDLIENNQRRIALLEKMAEEIYREWFVRLRFPGHEQVKVVKGVPEGWEQKRFGDFCTLQRGHDLPDSQVVSGPYPVVASTSIKTYHNQFKAKPPVVTTGRSGSLGTVLFVNESSWPLNTCLYVKNFHGNSCYLIYYTLKNMGLENFNAGAGVPSLNRNHISGITLVVPPKPLQDRFDSIIAPIFKQKELMVQASKALGKTRDSLLPRLISGKLSVENLDIQFPPSMADENQT